MYKKELARLIDDREYGCEPFRDVRQVAKEASLVIVSGASDDLMEFDGAIYDEGGCFDGGKVFLTGPAFRKTAINVQTVLKPFGVINPH